MDTGILPIFFSRGRGPGGVLIRAGIGSPWAHCGILHGSLALEATVPRVATPPARELLAQLRRAHSGRPLHELAAIGWVEMPAPGFWMRKGWLTSRFFNPAKAGFFTPTGGEGGDG